MRVGEWIKENVVPQPPLSTWWVCVGAAASLAALAAVVLIDHALPVPLTRDTAPKERFIAEIAHEHLVNLTSMGPRVAGSYENEVAAVGVLVAAVQRIARTASPHNRVELDLQTASGAFPLAFLDGMNNVYRGVQNVVARVTSAGGRARPARRSALLLNCHYDTVPDSPGASDDGAGCAVLLETMRALAAAPRPLRHDVVFLFNGAEENIMQASHGFITQHKWARSVRAFINIEACGAGGREVLFQAGPHDPWLMEVYASAAPHPFASSLAQELFESGLIPADTDFRIFRDFGNLSGVDLAWSANGYVYHTRLDTAQRVPRAALQRTGDNVLALVHGILLSGNLETEMDPSSRQPVFFDVLGARVVSARAPAAAAAAVAVVAAVLLRIHLNAVRASKQLYVRRRAWWVTVWRTLGRAALAHAAGVATATALAMVLHVAGARLAFYSRPWLLAPMYALPAVCVTWLVALRGRGAGGVAARGWWAARAWEDAAGAGGAALTAAAAATALRCGFLPLLWAAPIALSGILAHFINATDGVRAWLWCAACALPALQTWYLALNTLRMFVPITGRAGDAPADAAMGALVAALVLPAAGWLLPLVVASRRPHRLIYAGLCVCAATCALVASATLGTPYAPDAPQRLMVFHTRRTVHAAPPAPAAPAQHLYWVPTLDVNTPHSVDMYVAEMRAANATSREECARWLHCGAPYYLPVLSLIPRGHWLPAAAPPLPVLAWTLATADRGRGARDLHLNLTGPAHIVVLVSPAEGATVAWCSVAGAGAGWAPLEGPRWGARRTYFLALHAARRPYHWQLTLHIRHELESPPEHWADLSLAGHSLFGEHKLHAQHARLLNAFPAWVAATGWGVDLHLVTV